MLVITLNKTVYEYDIHSIIKAFFPEKTVKVLTPDTDREKALELAETGEALKGSIQFADSSEAFEGEVRFCLEEQSYLWNWRGELPEGTEAFGQEYKDAFKGFLYQSLCQYTGKTLPWGNMTGIRPTKIAMSLLSEGRSHEEIMAYYQGKHYVSEEKANLSIDIAERERKLLSTLHYEDGYSLYIGIPFCPTTCLYCSFTSYPIAAHRKRVDQYIDCLIKEMDYVREVYKDKILDTVYMGGGTPTTLEADQLDRLITTLKERFDFNTVQEFTVEAGRADSITREKLEVLYKHGVDRISVNPQTMNQCTLDTIGRRHTVEQVVEAYHMARHVGFENINMDLILGLPGEDVPEVTYTIEEVRKLNPDSLTIHSLAIKRASKLAQWIQRHGISCIHNTDETMSIAVAGAKAMDMQPYYLYRQKNMSGNFENVGYAREGKFGIYNILIMEELQTIVALGAGSITKLVCPDGRIERCDNVKDVELYINQIDEMIDRKRKLLSE